MEPPLPHIHTFTAEPKQNNQQTLDGHLFLNHEREQLETATKRVETETERYRYTPQTGAEKRKYAKKGMSTENNIGVQTRAMAQRVDNEANPEQAQRAMDQVTTPTVELHRTKEDTIKEFV